MQNCKQFDVYLQDENETETIDVANTSTDGDDDRSMQSMNSIVASTEGPESNASSSSSDDNANDDPNNHKQSELVESELNEPDVNNDSNDANELNDNDNDADEGGGGGDGKEESDIAAQAEVERLKAAEEEEARLKAEQEAKEEAARLKAEQEAEAARLREEEEARLKAEQEAREEAARLKAEEEARAEAERLRAEEEARLQREAEEEERRRKEAAERQAKEELLRIQAEEEEKLRKQQKAERMRQEQEQRLREEQRKIEEEQERVRKEEEERKQREEEDRKRKEEEDRKRKEAEEAQAAATETPMFIGNEDDDGDLVQNEGDSNDRGDVELRDSESEELIDLDGTHSDSDTEKVPNISNGGPGGGITVHHDHTAVHKPLVKVQDKFLRGSPKCYSYSSLKNDIKMKMQSLCSDSTNSSLCDATFSIGPKQQKFHVVTALFAIQSTELNRLLQQHRGRTIKIEDMTAECFAFLRRYFYGLNPIISVQNVSDILYAANKLKVNPLIGAVKQFLASIVRVNDLLSVLADLHGLRFYDICDQMISSRRLFQADHARDVFHSEKLNGLPTALMIRLLKTATFQSDLRMTEEQIFEKCTNWAKYQAEMRHIEERKASQIGNGTGSKRGSRESTPSTHTVGDDMKMQDPEEWKRIIQPLLPSIRFPTMKGEFSPYFVFSFFVVSMFIVSFSVRFVILPLSQVLCIESGQHSDLELRRLLVDNAVYLHSATTFRAPIWNSTEIF